MKSGFPAFVLEFVTSLEGFSFVIVEILNTGQDDESAQITLSATADSRVTPQEVSVDVAAGNVAAITLSMNGFPSWLSIRVTSDQLVTSASFFSDVNTVAARYLPGDFAVFNLLGGRTRQC